MFAAPARELRGATRLVEDYRSLTLLLDQRPSARQRLADEVGDELARLLVFALASGQERGRTGRRRVRISSSP